MLNLKSHAHLGGRFLKENSGNKNVHSMLLLCLLQLKHSTAIPCRFEVCINGFTSLFISSGHGQAFYDAFSSENAE